VVPKKKANPHISSILPALTKLIPGAAAALGAHVTALQNAIHGLRAVVLMVV
jgi:hypothetical protein